MDVRKEGVLRVFLPLWPRSGYLFTCQSDMMENKIENAHQRRAADKGVWETASVKGRTAERRGQLLKLRMAARDIKDRGPGAVAGGWCPGSLNQSSFKQS